MSQSLIDSQHLYRKATRERGIIELKMQRIDVRCGAMQSLATQATLIAGFAFGSLQPAVLDTLWNKYEESWVQWPYSIVFVLCTAGAFASSIWVIYISLYAGWRSQFSALQGGMEGVVAADAVEESLNILMLTTARVALWFSASLCFISISATLLAFAHLHPAVSVGLLVVFGFFLYDGRRFRRQLDSKFHAIGDGGFAVGSNSPEAAVQKSSYAPSRQCRVEVCSAGPAPTASARSTAAGRRLSAPCAGPERSPPMASGGSGAVNVTTCKARPPWSRETAPSERTRRISMAESRQSVSALAGSAHAVPAHDGPSRTESARCDPLVGDSSRDEGPAEAFDRSSAARGGEGGEGGEGRGRTSSISSSISSSVAAPISAKSARQSLCRPSALGALTAARLSSARLSEASGPASDTTNPPLAAHPPLLSSAALLSSPLATSALHFALQ